SSLRERVENQVDRLVVEVAAVGERDVLVSEGVVAVLLEQRPHVRVTRVPRNGGEWCAVAGRAHVGQYPREVRELRRGKRSRERGRTAGREREKGVVAGGEHARDPAPDVVALIHKVKRRSVLQLVHVVTVVRSGDVDRFHPSAQVRGG